MPTKPKTPTRKRTKVVKQLPKKPSRMYRQILIVAFIAIVFGYIGYSNVSKKYDTTVVKAVAYKVETAAATTNNSDYYGAKRAEIAMAEYNKGVKESTPGCNCGPDVDKYTEGLRSQWCTMFASWVTKEAGSPMTNSKTKSWKISKSRNFAENLQKNGTWFSREEVIANKLEPKTGDFIVYWRGDFTDELGHVDIVVNPGTTPGYADTVGGNLRDQIVLRNFPYRDNYGFLGFGRPEKN